MGGIVTAMVGAVAFAGVNYGFNQIGKNKVLPDEAMRHNLAMEKLQKANDEWSKRRQQLVDFYNREMAKKNEAIRVSKKEDYYLSLYTDAWNEQHPENKIQLGKKHDISEFYTPSQEMKNYEYLGIIVSVAATGLVIWYFTK